jgi:hypothetical protein
MLAMLVGLRVEAGFGPLPAELDDVWMSRDRLIVTTLKALDDGPGELAYPHKVRHVGPVLERERHAAPVDLPWPVDDPAPLVLVSFSTMPEQGSVPKFQNAIDALSQLPRAWRRDRRRQRRSGCAAAGFKCPDVCDRRS